MAARRMLHLIATLVAVGTTVVALALPASAADAGAEGDFVSRINAARSAAGLAPLSVASDLVAVARSHSGDMAAKNTLFHNPNLATEVTNWVEVGENVGAAVGIPVEPDGSGLLVNPAADVEDLQRALAVFRHSSKVSSAKSHWSRVITSGGHNRIVLSPAPSTSNPRSNAIDSTLSRRSAAFSFVF